MSINDTRRLENMNLIPEGDGGDTYFVNSAMVNVKKAAFAWMDDKE
jgi:hypothetical protein